MPFNEPSGPYGRRFKLGTVAFSDAVVTCHDEDPAEFPAGLAVRQDTTSGKLSLTVGTLIGVSLGRSQSNHKKTSVCRIGNGVPIRIKDESVLASGTIQIVDYAAIALSADEVVVGGLAFVAQAGAVTPGDATFQAATSDEATAASLAAQINAHAAYSDGTFLEASVVGDTVTITAGSAASGESGNLIELAYTDNGPDNEGVVLSGAFLSGGDAGLIPELGAQVLVDETSGEASSDGAETGAVYIPLDGRDGGPDPYPPATTVTGIDEDGNEVACAIIALPGGF